MFRLLVMTALTTLILIDSPVIALITLMAVLLLVFLSWIFTVDSEDLFW